MTPSARLATVVLAAAAGGAGLGGLARPRAPSGPERPAVVETLLRAVDRGDLGAVRGALAAAGPAAGYASPWRDEVELASLVAAADDDALWAFAVAPPPGAARARALLWLRERGKEPPTRDRAAERLATDYPRSWALRTSGVRARGATR